MLTIWEIINQAMSTENVILIIPHSVFLQLWKINRMFFFCPKVINLGTNVLFFIVNKAQIAIRNTLSINSTFIARWKNSRAHKINISTPLCHFEHKRNFIGSSRSFVKIYILRIFTKIFWPTLASKQWAFCCLKKSFFNFIVFFFYSFCNLWKFFLGSGGLAIFLYKAFYLFYLSFLLGTMVCCYLLYSGQKATADEALKFYGTKRTHDEKGKRC